jgi:hypothetical protein
MTQIERALAWKAANDILNTKNIPLSVIEGGTEIPTSLIILKALGLDPLAKEKMEKLLRDRTMRAKDKAALARSLTDEYRRYFLDMGAGAVIQGLGADAIQRRIALRKAALVEQYGETAMNEVMRNVIDTLNKESMEYGYSDFQWELFKGMIEATPESDLEKTLRADLEISRKAAKIRGKDAN